MKRTHPVNWFYIFPLCPSSGFSPEVVYYTMGTLPPLPLAPRLVKAGVSWVTLEWGRPEGSASEEQLKYTLEIQEDNSVSVQKVMSLFWGSKKKKKLFISCLDKKKCFSYYRYLVMQRVTSVT